MESTPNPDMDWYLNISRQREVTPRCPFASVERCPRYYYGLSLLGDASVATKMSRDEDERLKRKWENSELRPVTAEQGPSIFGNGEKHISFSKFCPETIYDLFGFFASDLHHHYDEVDRDFAHRYLTTNNVAPESWQWRYSSITPRHFTECDLYSPLFHSRGAPVHESLSLAASAQQKSDIFTLKPGMWGMNIDLKEVWRWFSQLLRRLRQ
jgi:hypothetical protein